MSMVNTVTCTLVVLLQRPICGLVIDYPDVFFLYYLHTSLALSLLVVIFRGLNGYTRRVGSVGVFYIGERVCSIYCSMCCGNATLLFSAPSPTNW